MYVPCFLYAWCANCREITLLYFLSRGNTGQFVLLHGAPSSHGSSHFALANRRILWYIISIAFIFIFLKPSGFNVLAIWHDGSLLFSELFLLPGTGISMDAYSFEFLDVIPVSFMITTRSFQYELSLMVKYS